MTAQTITRQKVIELIDELPSETLPEVAQFIEFLRFKTAQGQAEGASPAEPALLTIIHRRLPPDDQRRLSELRQKNEVSQLTEAERAELLAYVERVEREDAERAEALVELAHLRGVPLAMLLNELKTESAADVA
jgi:hypothetical protein